MRWVAVLLLIVVLQVPAGIWKKIPDQEKDRQVTQAICEFCAAYAKKYGVREFKIRTFLDDKLFMLDIVPREKEI